jgi:hypothetical protein
LASYTPVKNAKRLPTLRQPRRSDQINTAQQRETSLQDVRSHFERGGMTIGMNTGVEEETTPALKAKISVAGSAV